MAKSETDRLVEELGVVEAAARRKVAGVLFTYRCTIQCRHCLFGAAPNRPDVVMTPRQCADALALLRETGRVVHVAGGEAFLYWEVLAEALEIAFKEGCAPHFVETNCSFAADENLTRERLTFLAEHGVKGVLASADVFHQEFVPPENFLRVREITCEIFGEKNFYGSRLPAEEIKAFAQVARDEARLRDHVRRWTPCVVGTAHQKLAQHLDHYAPTDPRLPTWAWRGETTPRNCLEQFRAETLWELHVDPYGNIQTNCGVILGRLPETTPTEVLTKGPEKANRFVEILCRGGALGLADFARREHGFSLPEKVTQNCELCYLARRFLRRFYPDVFGPEEIYL